jgi:hypothetical protein
LAHDGSGRFRTEQFLLNVQFAFWLSPHEYGLFAISFTGFVDVDRRGSYLLALVRLHLLLLGSAIALCSQALIGAWGLGSTEIGWLIVGTGIGGSANLALSPRADCA